MAQGLAPRLEVSSVIEAGWRNKKKGRQIGCE